MTSSLKDSLVSVIATILFISSIFRGASSQFDSNGGTILSRSIRATIANTTTGNENISALKLAEDVDEDFPIIFNILLWLGISLAIATLAICVAIATMDPGRDSLIYRVTSGQRFKKDN